MSEKIANIINGMMITLVVLLVLLSVVDIVCYLIWGIHPIKQFLASFRFLTSFRLYEFTVSLVVIFTVIEINHRKRVRATKELSERQ